VNGYTNKEGKAIQRRFSFFLGGPYVAKKPGPVRSQATFGSRERWREVDKTLDETIDAKDINFFFCDFPLLSQKQ